MHGFLVAIRWLCGVTLADKLPYRTEPAHPPRAGPCAAPALPPGGGRPLSLLGGFQPPSHVAAVLSRGDDPPEPPDVGGASPHAPRFRVVARYGVGPAMGIHPMLRVFVWLVRFCQENVQEGYCALL